MQQDSAFNNSYGEKSGLARDIRVAHDLDEAIQDELYGHMEDKALGYLSGEEEVSQADVVLLTREHFGDARRLQEYLGQVHHVEAAASLGRRIVAVVAAGLGISVVVGVMRIVFAYSLAWNIPYFHFSMNWLVLQSFFPALFSLVALYAILKRWQRRIDTGENVWFQSESSGRLLAVVLGLFVLDWCIPQVSCNVIASWDVPSQEVLTNRALIQSRLMSVIVVLTALIWVWWIGQRPRRIQMIFYGGIAFFGYSAIRSLIMFLGFPSFLLHDSGSEFHLVQVLSSHAISTAKFAHLYMQDVLGTAFRAGCAIGVYVVACVPLALLVQRMREQQGGNHGPTLE